jgi:UDP-2-acetamido-2-deoxy-ribo-hexuluronate aminotransferase
LKIPYLDLTYQYKALENEINEMTQKILKSGQYILGPEVAECERKLAEFTGAPYCVTAASGTDALLMALLAEGVTTGDEVIVPAFSFFATAGVIALIGAIPVFVDINDKTFNIDTQKISKAITSKTKAIIPVSLYGQVADMDEIKTIAKKHGLIVMEDAAQSFGAMYRDKMSCNLSSYGCTSFFPAKPLGCFGDGGAVFCQSKEDYEKLIQIRTHGQESRYHHTRIGFNCRLDTLQCGILLVKLKRYSWEIEQRQRIANIYNTEFQKIESIQTPWIDEDRSSVYAQYTILVSHRDKFQNDLSELGVPTSIHYPKGMHQQPAVKHLGPFKDLNITETICEKVISLPLYADMPDDHVAYVVDKVKQVTQK